MSGFCSRWLLLFTSSLNLFCRFTLQMHLLFRRKMVVVLRQQQRANAILCTMQEKINELFSYLEEGSLFFWGITFWFDYESTTVVRRLFGSHELRFNAPRQDAQATVISQQGSVLFVMVYFPQRGFESMKMVTEVSSEQKRYAPDPKLT